MRRWEFSKYLKEERGKAENTILAYLRDIEAFEKFLASEGVVSLEQAENTHIVAYMMNMKGDKKAKSTINRRLSSIRSYYHWLMNTGYIDNDPTNRIKAPRVSKKDISFLSIEEVERLLDVPDESIKGMRDQAILEILYATGIRISEAIELKLSDVNMGMGFVECNGNHGRARIVPFGGPAKKAMKKYLELSRPALMNGRDVKDLNGPLFVNVQGEGFTRQGIWKLLRMYGEQAHLTERLTSQTLRNSFAVHMVRNGIDMKALQELMGHEDIMATQAYYKHIRNRIRDIYTRTHPRA